MTAWFARLFGQLFPSDDWHTCPRCGLTFIRTEVWSRCPGCDVTRAQELRQTIETALMKLRRDMSR